MKPFFTPDDFNPILDLFDMGNLSKTPEAQAALIANAKLEKALGPVVYGQGIGAMKSADWDMNGPEFERYKHTHQAILFNIQELPKECPGHEPDFSLKDGYASECKHCGVPLVAKWEEKK